MGSHRDNEKYREALKVNCIPKNSFFEFELGQHFGGPFANYGFMDVVGDCIENGEASKKNCLLARFNEFREENGL